MLQRLSMRLALWMVLVTIALQLVHAVYRLSTDIPQSKPVSQAEVERVVARLHPVMTQALIQHNPAHTQEALAIFAAYPWVQGAWLLDGERVEVGHWARNSLSRDELQQRRWPLYEQGKGVGSLRMSLDIHWATVAAKQQVWRQIWLSCLMGGLSLLLLYWVVRHQVTRPICELAQVVEAINTGNVSEQDLLMLSDMQAWAEVDQLRLSLQDILLKLSDNIKDKKKTMDVLQKFNESLEERVLARTKELNVAKDKSEQASRGKTDFLNNMTHELRTPLNSIMGFSSILKGLELPAKCQVPVARIHQSGTQLLLLINDIIDFADLESHELEVQSFSLFDAINTSHHALLAQVENKDIDLVMQVSDKAIMYGDPRRLGVVLRHLMGNAIKFTEQGRVAISCEVLPDDKVRICVSDTGIGIDVSAIETLNKAFVQADSGLNRSQQGVGLGLAIVERICKKWGGSLRFSNVSPHGTRVTMILPNLSAS
ncbi:MAG: HAMP domain-containing sensor histidine kinase [Bermanella sp.]